MISIICQEMDLIELYHFQGQKGQGWPMFPYVSISFGSNEVLPNCIASFSFLLCQTNPDIKYKISEVNLKIIFKVKRVQFGPLRSIWAKISETWL